MPSHAAEAMEMDANALLLNTALADTTDHTAIAWAFGLVVEAGRLAYLAGLGPERDTAAAWAGLVMNEVITNRATMEIISSVFAGSVISEGFGK